MGKEFKRMRYFDGLFLKAEDYNMDQEFHRRLQRLHNRYLHTWGIVTGLEVEPWDNGSMKVKVKEGIALNEIEVEYTDTGKKEGTSQQDTDIKRTESISQEILIYGGHPDNPIDLTGYAANEDIYITVSYEETLADRDLEKGMGEEIHIWERGRLSHSKVKPVNPKKDIILARVCPKLNGDNVVITQDCIFDTDNDGSPLRTYAGPAGEVLAIRKIVLKQGEINDGTSKKALEVNSGLTSFTGDVDISGNLVVHGNVNFDSTSGELGITDNFVQLNTPVEGVDWSLQDGGLEVCRGGPDDPTGQIKGQDARIVWVEKEGRWKAGLGNKLSNIAYGDNWEPLINNNFVDNLHRHSQLSYSKGAAVSVDDSGNIFMSGNLFIPDKSLYLKNASTNNGIRWCGEGSPFADVKADGPALFGSAGGVLGTKAEGNEKSVLSWNGYGNVGIGTADPKDDRLDVDGSLRILSKTNPVRFTSVWTGFPDSTVNQSEICNDTTYHKALMIVGNQSAGQGRKVAIWDRLDVNGFLQVNGSMKVSQSITPSAGNGNNGIVFPSDPGGGAYDAAWIKYYPKAGENCTLEIGVSNDGEDNISLMASGKVGIGTRDPLDKLDVCGWGRLLSDSNPIRFTSSWSAFPDNVANQAEISNDTTNYKALMIVGNRSSGQGRKVAIWDRLDVNGFLQVNGGMNITGNMTIGGSFNCGKLSALDVGTNFSASVRCADFLIGYPGRRGNPGRALVDNGNCLIVNCGPDWPYTLVQGGLAVSGAITPSAGNSENRGIMFPKDPGGGSGDAAWIRYYSDGSRGGGENMTLEIGVSNDYYGWGGWNGGDRIYMHASGGVFIGGYWYYGSSRDYKEDISNLNYKTAKQLLDGLNPVEFKFKGESTKTTLGFIAEDVPQELSAPDQKAVSPMEIVAVLTSIVKEQQKSINKLQKQIASIQGAAK